MCISPWKNVPCKPFLGTISRESSICSATPRDRYVMVRMLWHVSLHSPAASTSGSTVSLPVPVVPLSWAPSSLCSASHLLCQGKSLTFRFVTLNCPFSGHKFPLNLLLRLLPSLQRYAWDKWTAVILSQLLFSQTECYSPSIKTIREAADKIGPKILFIQMTNKYVP